jgi:hypothetical protein
VSVLLRYHHDTTLEDIFSFAELDTFVVELMDVDDVLELLLSFEQPPSNRLAVNAAITILALVLPQRWVVERSWSWLDKCRRLWKNCERPLTTSLQMVVLAFLALLLKRF